MPRFRRIGRAGCVLLAILVMASSADAAWVVQQLTDNATHDMDPQVSGSNVVWSGHDGSDYEVFLYDGASGTTTQITSNTLNDIRPQVSGYNVAWDAYDGSDNEVFFYHGASGTTRQVTNNTELFDSSPEVDGSNVVWSAGGLSHWVDSEVYLYDAVTGTTTQVTNNSAPLNDNVPRISGSNVAWLRWDGSDNEVFLHDMATGTTTQLTNNATDDQHVEVSGSTVVWRGYGGSDTEIYWYDGAYRQLTNNSTNEGGPQVSGSNVVWHGGARPHHTEELEIFLYDGVTGTTTQVTNDSVVDDWPQVSGSNVVWEHNVGGSTEIYLYDGVTVTPLTSNSYPDMKPQVSGSNVVWYGSDGSDYEIFLATLTDRCTWTRPPASGAGDWFVAGNWDSVAPPAAGDDAVVSNGGTAQIGAAGAVCRDLILGEGATESGTVELQSGDLATGRDALVGDAGSGTFTHTGGTHTVTGNLFLGVASGSSGDYSLSGAGAVLNVGGDALIGDAGTGTFTHTGGTHTVAGDLSLGVASGSSGDYSLSGAGAVLNVGGTVWVGDEGTGTLSVQNGASMSNQGGVLGREAGSNGTATVDGGGSTWTNSAALLVGPYGTGALTVQNGGSVSNTHGILGSESTGDGTVTVGGAGSTWANSQTLVVGRAGTGSLTVQNGASVSNTDNGYLGYFGGSDGTATVDGAGSLWDSSASLYVGGTDTGAGGSGDLTVSNGGEVRVGDTLKVWGPGTVNLNAGGLVVADVAEVVPGATFSTQAGSTLRVNSLTGFGDHPSFAGGVQFGHGAGSGSYALGAGQSFTVGEALHVGYAAAATFTHGGGTCTVGGTLHTGGGGVYTLGGGRLSVDALDNQGTFTWTGGTLEYRSAAGLTLGAGGPFGTALTIPGGGALEVPSGLTVQGGASLSAGGPATVSGPVVNDGTVNGPSGAGEALAFLGPLSGVGSFTGNVEAHDTLGPGHSPATMVFGNLALTPTSTLVMEVEGLAAGTEHDFLNVMGTLSLDGYLEVWCSRGFVSTVQTTDEVTLAAALNPLSGGFRGIVSGDVIYSQDGLLGFTIFYGAGSPHGANRIVLTGFFLVPEPGTMGLLGAGAAALGWRRRKRSRGGESA